MQTVKKVVYYPKEPKKEGIFAMKKWLWVIPVVVALLIAGGLFWYFTTDWTVTIGICWRDSAENAEPAYRQALESALEAEGYEVLSVDSNLDQARQIRLIQELADRTCQVVIVEPVMDCASDELLAAIRMAKVGAVLVEAAPEETLTAMDRITYVGHDRSVPGSLLAQMMLELPGYGDINEDGVVSCMILQGPEDDLLSNLYLEHCKKAIKLSPAVMEVLSVCYADGSRERGSQLCAGQLSKFGRDIEVILCTGDAMALGAMEAISAGGRQVGQDIYLLSIGGTQEAADAVAAGTLTGTVRSNGEALAGTVFTAARKLMNGEAAEPYYYLDYSCITAQE